MEVSGTHRSLTPLSSSRKNPGNHSIGGWVAPHPVLTKREKWKWRKACGVSVATRQRNEGDPAFFLSVT